MKTILLVRHAKSGWGHLSQPDFERTLTESGKEDAKKMGKRLKENHLKIDLFVSSSAIRARNTAEIFMKEFNVNASFLEVTASLYNASAKDFYNAVESLDDNLTTAAIFSHNPGITDFVNSLDCSFVNDMPTCAVYAVRINTKNWSRFREAEKELLFFDYPKS